MDRFAPTMLIALGRASSEVERLIEGTITTKDAALMAVRFFHFCAMTVPSVVKVDFKTGDLCDWLVQFEKRIDESEDLDLSTIELFQLRTRLRSFVADFSSKIKEQYFYVVKEKGGYSTAKLIEEPESFFGSAWAKMPDKAKGDFRQAATCLAFDLPTACGFHSVRAVELMVREWYDSVFGKPAKYPVMWQCIKDIRKELESRGKIGDEERSILDFLHKIRKHDRNPLAHPEKSLTCELAILLFGDCVSTACAIVRYVNP